MKKFNNRPFIRKESYNRKPVLLVIRGPRGILTSCGSACYDSIFQKCVCICKGSNHRQGYKKALQNSLNHIARLKKENPELSLSLHSSRALAKLNQQKLNL